MCDPVFDHLLFSLLCFDPAEQDEEIRKIQVAVTTGMSANGGLLQTYLKTWDKYRDIWEIKKDSFIQRYQRMNPTVMSFDMDILRHGAITTAPCMASHHVCACSV